MYAGDINFSNADTSRVLWKMEKVYNAIDNVNSLIDKRSLDLAHLYL